MLARLVLNAVVFQFHQSDLQTKTGAYSLGKCVERIVLTHSREFVWVLPLGLLCLVFCFFVSPLTATEPWNHSQMALIQVSELL